jgi:hypothetical protein
VAREPHIATTLNFTLPPPARPLRGDTFVPFMLRRTITIPESTEKLVRDLTLEGESFSAAVTRLIQLGALASEGRRVPSYVGIAEGPSDLSLRAEEYLRDYFANEWTD